MVLIEVQPNTTNTIKTFQSMHNLRLYKKYLKFLGIYPFIMRRNKWFSKILAILFMGIYMLNTIWVSITLTFFPPFELNVFEKYLEMVTFLTPCLFYGRIVYVQMTKSESWKNIFSNLLEFDRKCHKYKCYNETVSYGIRKIVLMNLIVLITPAVAAGLWVPTLDLTSLEDSMKTVMANEIAYLYQFNIGGFLWELSSVIESRYAFVKDRIKTVMVKRKCLSNYKLDKELQDIRHLYKLLYFCMENTSKVFGVTILFCLIHFTTFQLENFYWTVVMCKNGEYVYIYIVIIYLLSFVVLAILLVGSCDKLQSSGESIVQSCFVLQDNIGKPSDDKKLKLLTEFLKVLAPKISASGLFCINRKFYTSLIAFTLSYVIIVLQFRNV